MRNSEKGEEPYVIVISWIEEIPVVIGNHCADYILCVNVCNKSNLTVG